ncbi:MAG: LPXTG cell wall anchor domain-containing protein, partial [Clostridiales Family XIII bacterium]|nr:LPXTG cell wall anchor domain-containing protein [Clostridiales Family XIII bacterium]
EADIDYTNEYGEDKNISSGGIESPDVYTGGYNFVKVDSNDANTKLQGAKFKLVKRLSNNFENDLAAAKTAAGNNDRTATTDGYYKNPNVPGHDPADALVATSNANGYGEFKGIAYGKPGEEAKDGTPALFWLVEVKAPDGYRLPGVPKEIEINFTSYNKDHSKAAKITNARGFEFPLTGGMGTLIFVVSGIVLIGLAGIVVASSRRKERHTESV